MITWIVSITVALFVTLAVAYVYAIRWSAIQEVKQAPREDMVECHSGKHGPYPKKFAIVSHDYGTKEPVYLCPYCYEQACKMAKESAGLKSNSPHKI